MTEKSNPMAVSYQRLSRYCSDWSLEEIVVFEKLLIARKMSGRPVFHHTDVRLAAECRINRKKFLSTVESLKDRGMLQVKQYHDRGHKFFSFNERYILENVGKVFNICPDIKDEGYLKTLKAYYREFLRSCFTKPVKARKMRYQFLKKVDNQEITEGTLVTDSVPVDD